jgi:DNA-3-methyladenine glycosylase
LISTNEIWRKKPLPKVFYEIDTIDVAKRLLGKLVLRKLDGNLVGGRIVETEGYKGKEDPASHAFRGLTKRNYVMFGEPGHAYVYFTYGMYYCLNFVTEPKDIPGAVLIRAIQPLFGVGVMLKNRRSSSALEVCMGPGRLTRAMRIDLSLNGKDLTKKTEGLFVVEPEERINFEISSSPRIGVRSASDREWRFFVRDNPFVSRRRW